MILVDSWAKNKCYSISNTMNSYVVYMWRRLLNVQSVFVHIFYQVLISVLFIVRFLLFTALCRSCGVLNQVGRFCWIIKYHEWILTFIIRSFTCIERSEKKCFISDEHDKVCILAGAKVSMNVNCGYSTSILDSSPNNQSYVYFDFNVFTSNDSFVLEYCHSQLIFCARSANRLFLCTIFYVDIVFGHIDDMIVCGNW